MAWNDLTPLDNDSDRWPLLHQELLGALRLLNRLGIRCALTNG